MGEIVEETKAVCYQLGPLAIFLVLPGPRTSSNTCFLKFHIKSPELKWKKWLILSLIKVTMLDLWGVKSFY